MPAIGAQKTIHKRNQSSPALSSVLQAGGLKAAAKRTAFGDVSNTANVLKASKDDSAIGSRAEYSIPEKATQLQQDKKTTSILKPAQRPLSVSGLKGLLSNVTNPTNRSSHQQTVKQPLIEVNEELRQTTQAFTRKVQAKKSNTIFKDAVSIQPTHIELDLQRPLPSTATAAPVHREFLPQQQSKTTDQNKEPQAIRFHAQTRYEADSERQDLSAEPPRTATSSEEPAVLRSDGTYIDEHGRVQFYKYADSAEPVEVAVNPVAKMPAVPVKSLKENDEVEVVRVSEAQLPKPPPEPVRKATLAPVSEPEEYWDEEGDENYDEDGYVTARSFKSRGENTTGGATTVLFPKLNQRARREIAAAKDLIEGSKTAEELEDEAWDTTMVAEYGEEIFHYMKDLEVGLPFEM